MRVANHAGRAVLLTADPTTATDVEEASEGAFGPSIDDLYPRWAEFRAWAATAGLEHRVAVDPSALGAPSTRPRQVMAIGLNYAEHAAETGLATPEGLPPVFTKFASSITGPYGEVRLPAGDIDWEVEVVAVIGAGGRDIAEEHAWSHVAGLTVGQDLSERVRQFDGPAPQFGLWKSFEGFSPIGPWLVTVDEFADPDDLALGCAIDGETVQDGRTGKLISSIPHTIAELSRVIELYPGDLIFTGTPDGVGLGRNPQRFLMAGETLTSWVEGVGEIRQTFV